MIAFPDSLDDTTLLAALDKAGIKGSMGVSNIRVPISDFSRIIMVNVQEARSRTGKGDPRRTPLLENLESSFYFTGPDASQWRAIYIPSITSSTDAAIVRTFTDIGTPWAWDAKPDTKGLKLLWLPVLTWTLWLLFRRTNRYRLEQLLYSLACLPILLQGSIEAFLVLALLEAVIAVGLPFMRAKWIAKLPFAVLPYVVPIVLLAFIEPGLIVLLVITIMLGGLVVLMYPRLVRYLRNSWDHQPPVFITLVPSSLKKNQIHIARSLIVPLSTLLLIFFILPYAGIFQKSNGQALFIERSLRPAASESTKIINNHLSFQFILTYGRLGEAKWGDDDYTLAYRYNEKEGRLSRTSPVAAFDDWSSIEAQLRGELVETVLILSERRPVRVALQ